MKDNIKPNLFISFSGGKTSADMTKWVLENKSDEYNIVVAFANTGKEREETLIFVDQCEKWFGVPIHWVEAKVHNGKRKGCTHQIVSYETASRHGEPFEEVIKKYGIPNMSFPHCTRELKTNPLHSFAKKYFGSKNYYTAIGIRIDEIDRIAKDSKKKKYVYPFISWFPSKKEEINARWEKRPFNLDLKPHEGNCDLCHKKVLSKLIQLCRDNPDMPNWWGEMEEKYSSNPPSSQKSLVNKVQNGGAIYFNRGNMSIKELVSKANDPNFKLSKRQLKQFNACSESCEVF